MESQIGLVDLLLIAPAISIFISSLLPIGIKVFRNNQELNPITTVLWAFIGLFAGLITTFAASGIETNAFNDALVFDGVSLWSTVIIIFITGFSLFIAKENLATVSHQFSEFVFLLLNASVGMILLAWSNDLIVTFIAIEIMSLCLYMLIALSNEERLSKEAAFKYFILGSFGSAIFLYGVAFVYGVSGTTYLNELLHVRADLISTNRLFVVGTVLVFIGFFFKVGLAPFHAWTPDVYEGSPTPVTGYMATGVKVVTFAAIIRFIGIHFLGTERALDIVNLIQWVAVASMLLGNIAAIVQDNLKRMLAYSSISHSGYALVGVIATGLDKGSVLGSSGTLFYIFAYSIMTLGTFGFVSLFEKREDTRLSISQLKGLASHSPWLALAMTIMLLSLAGIPPTIGFFSKFFIFSAAIEQGLIWLSIWGVISSVISIYYYLRPIVYMYMQESSEDQALTHVKDKPMTAFSLGTMAVLVILVGFFSEPFYSFIYKAVSTF